MNKLLRYSIELPEQEMAKYGLTVQLDGILGDTVVVSTH